MMNCKTTDCYLKNFLLLNYILQAGTCMAVSSSGHNSFLEPGQNMILSSNRLQVPIYASWFELIFVWYCCAGLLTLDEEPGQAPRVTGPWVCPWLWGRYFCPMGANMTQGPTDHTCSSMHSGISRGKTLCCCCLFCNRPPSLLIRVN